MSIPKEENVADIRDKCELQGSRRVLKNEDYGIEYVKKRRYGQDPGYIVKGSTEASVEDFGSMVWSDPRFDGESEVTIHENYVRENPDYIVNLKNTNFSKDPLCTASQIEVVSEPNSSQRTVLERSPERYRNAMRLYLHEPNLDVILNYFGEDESNSDEISINEVLAGFNDDQEDHVFDWYRDSRL